MIARMIRHNLVKVGSRLRINYFRFLGVRIGKRCFISRHAHIDLRRGRIVIGDDVHIGGGSYVLSHTGFRPNHEGKETVIEDHVRVFVNSVILPGIRVGRNSIIGAGSVVMKDIPPYVAVQGNPARVIQHLDRGAEGDSDPENSSA